MIPGPNRDQPKLRPKAEERSHHLTVDHRPHLDFMLMAPGQAETNGRYVPDSLSLTFHEIGRDRLNSGDQVGSLLDGVAAPAFSYPASL
jgi:hypothetical protein